MGFIFKISVIIATLYFSSTHCQAAASLCGLKLPSRSGIVFSFIVPSNIKEIPEDYKQLVNSKTECIIFMEMRWNEDVQLQFSPLRIGPTRGSSTVRIVTTGDYIQVPQSVESKTITKLTETKIPGNTIRSFAIIYNRKAGVNAPFLYRIRTATARRLLCPDLESQFGSVTCSNGREVGSECKFQCKESGFYPSPDLYNPETESTILKTFQSSEDRKFFSVCSLLGERRRPAWKPDALAMKITEFGVEWTDVTYYWKCVDRQTVEDVCLVFRNHAPRLLRLIYLGVSGQKEFFYGSRGSCYYPQDYLLSIFGEERGEEIATTTAAPTTVASTNQTVPNKVRLRVPNVAESHVVDDGSVNCATYCKFDSATNSYTPKCGDYGTDIEQIDCLTCRYVASSCLQRDVVAG